MALSVAQSITNLRLGKGHTFFRGRYKAEVVSVFASTALDSWSREGEVDHSQRLAYGQSGSEPEGSAV
jgi:hypothetical protein